MRKASKRQRDSDMLLAYDFRGGVRGKYVERYKESNPDVPEVIVHAWAPLIGFPWAGSERKITDDTWIRARSAYREYEESKEFKYSLDRKSVV